MTIALTLAPEDVLDLVQLLDARFSPDGKSAAYVLSTVDKQSMTDLASIWLVDIDTGRSRRLTTGAGFDSAPSWSPDGKSITFRSTRSGAAQLYIVPINGGEAGVLTRLPNGVGTVGPLWSPDGKYIAFTARPGEPRDKSKPYRVTRSIWRFDGLGMVEDAKQELYVIPAGGGEARRLTQHDGIITSLEWSQAGDEILYVSYAEPNSRNVFVRVFDVNAGRLRTVYEDEYAFFPPVASFMPDGRIVRTNASRLVDQSDLIVTDGDGASPDVRTKDIEGYLFGVLQTDFSFVFVTPRIVVGRDGKSAYVFVQVGGTLQIHKVRLDGESGGPAVVAGERASVPYDASSDQLLFGTTTMDSPVDLWVAKLDGSEQRRLTRLNEELVQKTPPFDIHHLQFEGEDGVPVEGWYMLPRNAQGPYPTVLNIHGGPHAGFGHLFSFDNLMMVSAGYGVMFINQRGSTGYGMDFAMRLLGDWGNLDYTDLMRGVDCAVERGLADPNRLGVWGISGGGYLTAWIVTHTDRFKAAVSENPVTNWMSWCGADTGHLISRRWMGSPNGSGVETAAPYVRFSPSTYAANCKTPALLIQHELDLRTPPAQSDEFYGLLKAHGCEAEMLRMPVSYHGGSVEIGSPVTRVAQNGAILEWMNRFVLS